jgi:cobyrinic acid a,c-diamide synthase
MSTYKTPRIIISGTASRVGKSLFTLGLAVALRKRKLSVSVVVLGPNLGQALLYYRVTRRYARILDCNLLNAGQLKFGLDQASVGADILLIDGNAGLFDFRHSSNSLQSDSNFAAWSNTPVLLVMDGANMEDSIGPLVRGFWSCAEKFPFAGVVVNNTKSKEGKGRTSGEAFEQALLDDELDCYLGGFPALKDKVELPHQFMFEKGNSTTLPRRFFLDSAEGVEEHVKIDAILAAADGAGPIGGNSQKDRLSRRCRIAVADDSCFGFTFQDNLELLRYFGAELVCFSPLADSDLPERIGAIYLVGSFLQNYAADVSQNSSMKAAIRKFVSEGGLVFAEGNSAAYLCENFSLSDGGVFDGVGIIPAIADAGEGNLTYTNFKSVGETLLGLDGVSFKGVNPQEWQVIPSPGVQTMINAMNQGGTSVKDGFSPLPNVLAMFGLAHFGSNPEIAKGLVDQATLYISSLTK